MAAAGPLAHFDEDQGAIRRAHDEVNFTATASGRSIIALHQPQLVPLQMRQRQRLGGIAGRLGGGFLGVYGRKRSNGWHG